MQCILLVAFLPFGGFLFLSLSGFFCLGGEWGTKVNGDDSISRLGSDFTLLYVWSGLFFVFFVGHVQDGRSVLGGGVSCLYFCRDISSAI